MTQIRRFSTTHDKELWTLSVGDITLPFYCTPGEMSETDGRVWSVLPATFAGSMFHAIRPMLESLTYVRHETTRFVKDVTFQEHFRKCPGVTPDFYISRGSFKKSAEINNNITISPGPESVEEKDGPDDFVKWLETETGMYSAKDWKVIVMILFQQIPRYMLTFNRSFDFGWAHLTALPVRANAMAIMMAKFPRIWKWLKSPLEHHKLEISPFSTESKRADILDCRFYQGKTLLSWNLFISPTKTWHEYIRSLEADVHTRLGPRAYLARVGDLLHRNWRNFLATLRSYAESSTAACGDVASPEHPTTAHLVVYKPQGGVSPLHLSDVPADYVVDTCEHGVYPAVNKGGRTKEAPYVQDVPYVPIWSEQEPDDGNLRGGRGKTRGRSSGGMLVRGKTEIGTPSESVLPEDASS